MTKRNRENTPDLTEALGVRDQLNDNTPYINPVLRSLGVHPPTIELGEGTPGNESAQTADNSYSVFGLMRNRAFQYITALAACITLIATPSLKMQYSTRTAHKPDLAAAVLYNHNELPPSPKALNVIESYDTIRDYFERNKYTNNICDIRTP